MSPAEVAASRRFAAALAGLTAVALLLRMVAAARALDVLDRWFIPDDTYYVLAIARSMAEGLGPAANGEVLTSGFQPLLAFLLVPVFALTSDLDLPIRIALVFLGACDAVNTALLGWLASRWQGAVAGLVAAGLWAISPVALDNALGGLETALALCVLLGMTALWIHHRTRPSGRSALALGAAVGLALLARVDTVFFVALLGLFELIGRQRKHLFAIVPAAAAVVAPWWLYCLSRFGTILPDSGAAAREVAHAYQGLLLSPLTETLWATWTIVGPPFVELRALRLFFYTLPNGNPLLGLFAGMAGVSLLLALGVATSVRVARALEPTERPPFVTLVLHGAIIATFYAHYVPVLWFFKRYTSPTAAAVTVLLSAAVAWAWRVRTRPAGKLGLVLLGAAIAVSLAGLAPRLFADPRIADDYAVDGPTGHRAPTVELLAATPRGSTVAGLQSGALSYFAPEDVTVHNLDGVVDRAAALAFKNGELGALLRERDVTYFIDWELQHDMLRARAGAVSLTLEPIKKSSFEQQSHHRLQLSEIRW